MKKTITVLCLAILAGCGVKGNKYKVLVIDTASASLTVDSIYIVTGAKMSIDSLPKKGICGYNDSVVTWQPAFKWADSIKLGNPNIGNTVIDGGSTITWQTVLDSAPYLTPGNKIYIDSLPQPKTDTIPIIYLYSDTASIPSSDWVMRVGVGYEVIETTAEWNHEVEPMTWRLIPTNVRKSIGYLDRNKQPIRKVIIWQTKTIEK